MSLLSPPTPAQREFNDTQRDYRKALHILRGNPLQRIAVRDQARAAGVDTAAIPNVADRPMYRDARRGMFQTQSDEAAKQAELNRKFTGEATAPFGKTNGSLPAWGTPTEAPTASYGNPLLDTLEGGDGETELGSTLGTSDAPIGDTLAAPAEEAAPKSKLGGFAAAALGRTNMRDPGAALRFRQGMDNALGMAKTEQDRNDLRTIAGKAGIGSDAFDSRANWWRNRR